MAHELPVLGKTAADAFARTWPFSESRHWAAAAQDAVSALMEVLRSWFTTGFLVCRVSDTVSRALEMRTPERRGASVTYRNNLSSIALWTLKGTPDCFSLYVFFADSRIVDHVVYQLSSAGFHVHRLSDSGLQVTNPTPPTTEQEKEVYHAVVTSLPHRAAAASAASTCSP